MGFKAAGAWLPAPRVRASASAWSRAVCGQRASLNGRREQEPERKTQHQRRGGVSRGLASAQNSAGMWTFRTEAGSKGRSGPSCRPGGKGQGTRAGSRLQLVVVVGGAPPGGTDQSVVTCACPPVRIFMPTGDKVCRAASTREGLVRRGGEPQDTCEAICTR